tara:strand:+ start:2983 stop:3402 length:420 start_codon:yes stop_codon:yes gene_type:complete
MKKLVLLVFTLSILTFSCSTGQDSVSINQDLVGSWSGYVMDRGCDVDLVLFEDATGEIEFYGGMDCNDFSEITWSASSSSLTLNSLTESLDENGDYVFDDDGNYVYEVESDVFNYELNSTGDVLNVTDDEGQTTTLYAF